MISIKMLVETLLKEEIKAKLVLLYNDDKEEDVLLCNDGKRFL